MQCEVPLMRGSGERTSPSGNKDRQRRRRAINAFIPCFVPSRSSEANLFAVGSRGQLPNGIELTLSMLFGLGAWLTVNGVFVELPLLVRVAPEGWALPSHLSLAVQAANAGPILYLLLLRYCPKARRFASRTFAIYAVLALGALASIALAFTWDRPVGGKSWSIIILTFFFALVGCTSSVLFIPFMAAFRPRSLAAYFTGEGVGGLLPGVIALVQGVGGEAKCDDNGNPIQPTPLFSSQVYFCCLFVLMLCSIVGFGLLEKKAGGVQTPEDSGVPPQSTTGKENGTEGRSDSDDTGTSGEVTEMGPPPLGTLQLAFLLATSAWVCLLANGLLPGIQSYSCAPYGNVAYHLSATLAAMANPATCLVAFFTPLRYTFSLSRSTPPHVKLCLILGLVALAATVLSSLAITTAVLSPTPPLIGTTAGEVLIILVWISLTIGAVYAKVGAAGALQEADSMQHGKHTGRGPLLWYGAFTQAGSAIGSLVAFLAVTEWNLFVAVSPC